MRQVLCLLFTFALLAGGGGDVGAQEPMLLPAHPEKLVVETGSGTHSFTIEIADNAQARGRGLMFRDELEDDRGMLFVFSDSRPRSFWMANVPHPLDLLFIGEDGAVRAVERGVPYSRASIAPGVDTRFVLELKHGTARRTGIGIGARLRHPVIDAVADGD